MSRNPETRRGGCFAIFDHVKPRSLSPSICDLETLNLGLALDLALPLSMGSGWHRKLYCPYGLPRPNLRTHYTSQLELRTI